MTTIEQKLEQVVEAVHKLSSHLEELWDIVGHMIDREKHVALALGIVEASDFSEEPHMDTMVMREVIAKALHQPFKFHKSIGEGGREEVDPAVR